MRDIGALGAFVLRLGYQFCDLWFLKVLRSDLKSRFLAVPGPLIAACVAFRSTRYSSTNRCCFGVSIFTWEASADKPILYLVNTNYHGDHTFGNYAFPEDTRIVAHQLRPG